MKVLITGASGLLGRSLMETFQDEETLGLAYSRATDPLKQVDLTNQDELNECIRSFNPHIIIHSAAIRKPDICQNDPDLTVRMNVDSTRWLAQAAKACGAWVLYLSTDYVFDGTNPPYDLDDEPNPVNIYGKSKLDGEKALLETIPNAAVLRVPILYGQVEDFDESAITVIAGQVLAKKESSIDHWATRYPTHVQDVAGACNQLSKAWLDKNDDIVHGGIFHFAGTEPMTKADMAKVIGDVLNIDISHLQPDPGGPSGTPRPKDCRLNCSRIEKLPGLHRTPFREGIQEVLSAHKKSPEA